MAEEVVVVAKAEGSIIGGMIWMAVISILLFWLPVIGPLVAGVVGGKKAGGVMAGMMAALLPAILIGGLLFVFGSALTGIPILSMIAGAGALVLSLAGVGPLLIGAIVGGALA
ncbi:MAG: hypothetical protein KDI36_01490 [Pseudomonadales bacterium]|nr:hypothetical protein [Pseudomonadales bacterium]